MSTDPQNLKSLWRTLPSETVSVSVEQMYSRATKFHTKRKRRDMIEYLGIVALLGLMIWFLTVQSDWKIWVASGLALCGAIIMLWNYNKVAKVKSAPPSKFGDSLLGFMRQELTRQRDAAATAWKWYILPAVPFFTFVIMFRWMEEGSTLTEVTDMRLALLLLTAFLIAYLTGYILWCFLCAARYQRQLDDLERYVTN